MGNINPTSALDVLQFAVQAAQPNPAAEAKKAQYKNQVAYLRQSQALDDQARQDRLRRAVAAQRARFGAHGLDAGDGSSDAVLSGIESSSLQEQSDQQSLLGLRLQSLESQYNGSSARSLLSSSSDNSQAAFSALRSGLQSSSLLDW